MSTPHNFIAQRIAKFHFGFQSLNFHYNPFVFKLTLFWWLEMDLDKDHSFFYIWDIFLADILITWIQNQTYLSFQLANWMALFKSNMRSIKTRESKANKGKKWMVHPFFFALDRSRFQTNSSLSYVSVRMEILRK